MSETPTTNPNIHISKANRVSAAILALIVAGALGIVAKRGVSGGEAFRTDIPIPKAGEPHTDYQVKAGDTEGGITAKFNLAGLDPLAYENMINEQIPKADQHDRRLQPGEELRLPPVIP